MGCEERGEGRGRERGYWKWEGTKSDVMEKKRKDKGKVGVIGKDVKVERSSERENRRKDRKGRFTLVRGRDADAERCKGGNVVRKKEWNVAYSVQLREKVGWERGGRKRKQGAYWRVEGRETEWV